MPETYKGRTFEIKNNEIFIDGKRIDVGRDSTGRFTSSRFSYSSFENIADLAKAIIDNM